GFGVNCAVSRIESEAGMPTRIGLSAALTLAPVIGSRVIILFCFLGTGSSLPYWSRLAKKLRRCGAGLEIAMPISDATWKAIGFEPFRCTRKRRASPPGGAWRTVLPRGTEAIPKQPLLG